MRHFFYFRQTRLILLATLVILSCALCRACCCTAADTPELSPSSTQLPAWSSHARRPASASGDAQQRGHWATDQNRHQVHGAPCRHLLHGRLRRSPPLGSPCSRLLQQLASDMVKGVSFGPNIALPSHLSPRDYSSLSHDESRPHSLTHLCSDFTQPPVLLPLLFLFPILSTSSS